jgi:hypothetical protein
MIGDISHIIVIESLVNERLTGSELYNDIIRRNIEFKKSGISHKFYETHSKESFINILNYYHANAPYMGGGILLHLEMHGDQDLSGLVLSDGTLLTWKELVDLFRPINVNSCNKLYLSLATCNGRFLYKGVHPHDKSPYSCYISASETVNLHQIVDQFSILFEQLIDNGNLITSYLLMEKQGTKFYYKDSKETFEEAFQVTAKRFMTDPEIKREILEETKRQVEKEGLQMPADYAFEFVARMALRDTYNRHKQAFEFDCD